MYFLTFRDHLHIFVGQSSPSFSSIVCFHFCGPVFTIIFQYCLFSSLWASLHHHFPVLSVFIFVGQSSPSFSSIVCFHLCGPVFTIIFQYCLFSSLWASLHHHFPVLSIFSHLSCQLVFLYIFSVVVDPSPSRPPLLLFPGTTLSIIFLDRLSSSLLLICPYQFNRFCLRNVDIWHTLASSGIIWFLTWSFLVLLLIHRSILISVTCNLFSSFILTAQHSAPCVIVGLITVLYTLSFSLMGTFLSHSTPGSCFHVTHVPGI